MDSNDSNRRRLGWASHAMNSGLIKRSFPGGVPELDAVSVTRVIVEETFLVLNVHLHPLPASISEAWRKAKYDRVDIRITFYGWVVLSQPVRLADLVGVRTVQIDSKVVSIVRDIPGGSSVALQCSWDYFDVRVLPDLLEAKAASDRDVIDTDIRPTDRM